MIIGMDIGIRLPGKYDKRDETKAIVDPAEAFYDSFVSLDPDQRPFNNAKEVDIQSYVMKHLATYKLDVGLCEREHQVFTEHSFVRPDMIFYYPNQPRIQDNIAMIVECKKSALDIEKPHNGWSYLHRCLKACKYAKYGMLSNGNTTRFCIKSVDEITEATEGRFWPQVQAVLGSPFWMAADEMLS